MGLMQKKFFAEQESFDPFELFLEMNEVCVWEGWDQASKKNKGIVQDQQQPVWSI